MKIQGFYGTDTTPRPFDTARTGSHGGYNGIGPRKHDGDRIEGARLTLKPRKIDAKVCGGDTVDAG